MAKLKYKIKIKKKVQTIFILINFEF